MFLNLTLRDADADPNANFNVDQTARTLVVIPMSVPLEATPRPRRVMP